ncbi:hypothetical protein FACS189463_3320 [Bacteroidia bacterium]|nr:hypothetical protein FACS189463_3320 [Bacteroidia bacterium]
MQNISFYIAYLLTRRECVIVPGFGAFIVSGAETDLFRNETLFTASSALLGFNSEIRHNDGLLANTLSKGEKISYQEACLQIRQSVDLLNTQLDIQRNVSIPWVGNLTLSSENKILFTPAPQLSCNAASFGLQVISVPTLSELEAMVRVRRRKKDEDIIYFPIHRRLLRWTASAAAVFAVLFLTSAPLNQSGGAFVMQKAAFPAQLPRPVIAETVAEPDTFVLENTIETTELSVEMIDPATATPVLAENPNQRYYYIVIASVSSQSVAVNEMKRLSQFPNLNVISKENRHRIYVRRFAGKPEAETYLNRFRKDYPQHADAWLLAQ